MRAGPAGPMGEAAREGSRETSWASAPIYCRGGDAAAEGADAGTDPGE